MAKLVEQTVLKSANTKTKCSPFLAIREMQIKTTLRFLLIPGRMAIMKKTNTTNAGKDEEKKDFYMLLVGM
jgi:hypothetical protein